jgi:hypothetical protein
VDHYVYMCTHHRKLMNSVGSHGCLWLLFMMRVMVWQLWATLIRSGPHSLLCYLQSVGVEVPLQSHRCDHLVVVFLTEQSWYLAAMSYSLLTLWMLSSSLHKGWYEDEKRISTWEIKSIKCRHLICPLRPKSLI